MGIGFVLFFWVLILAVIATPAALILIVSAYVTDGREGGNRFVRTTALRSCAGFIYLLTAFLLYWWSCAIRDVDPGIGDSWSVPLSGRYSLAFIDLPDCGFVTPRGGGSGAVLVEGVTRIGQSGRHVYGDTAADAWLGYEPPEEAFFMNTDSGEVRYCSLQELPALLGAAGIEAQLVMTPVEKFYSDRRWGWPDLLAGLLFLVPPIWMYRKQIAMFHWSPRRTVRRRPAWLPDGTEG